MAGLMSLARAFITQNVNNAIIGVTKSHGKGVVCQIFLFYYIFFPLQ